jgi:DNA-binding transcriptional LysR family regulator
MKARDLGLMLALDALLEEQNVTRAAARLSVSQPALSAQLARLRSLFDDPLLVPALSGRGMIPTPRALVLKGVLRDVLTRFEDVMDGPQEFDPVQSRRSFNIIANDNVAMVIGAALVARLRELGASNIRVAFLPPTLAPLAERLERGEADLAFGANLGSADGLIRRVVYEDRFMTAQRKGHPRGCKPLDIRAYCGLDHLMVSPGGGGFETSVDQALKAIGSQRRVVVSLHGFSQAPAFLAQTDLLCTAPSRFLRLYRDRLDIFETPIDLPKFAIPAFWHPRVRADPANVWLRARLVEAASESD